MTTSFFSLQINGEGIVTISKAGVLTTYTGPGSHSVSAVIGMVNTISYTSSSPNKTFSNYTATPLINIGNVNQSNTSIQLNFNPPYGGFGTVTVNDATITNLTVEQNNTTGCSIVSVPAGISTTASGPLTDTASFPVGTDVTLIASVGPGKFLTGWSSGLIVGSNLQTKQPIITFKLRGPYLIKATFSNIESNALDIFRQQQRDYVPNQGERADALHICQCPCACTGCNASFISAVNRTRQTRALISGNCCQMYPVGVIFTNGGLGYAEGDILQLQGGTPLEQPALFKVIDIIGGGPTGQIRQMKLIYGQPYRVRPDVDVLVPYTGSGIGGDFSVLWASCLSPANLYRQ